MIKYCLLGLSLSLIPFFAFVWLYPTEVPEHELTEPALIKVEVEPMPPEDVHLKRLAYEVETSIIKPNARLQEIKNWDVNQ